ncbi:1-acyl-sn-glycerol-3-phosphate acyltransferase [Lutimonas sp.]|uniref:1-acyl-sn-glycerol-3-phosphate acyltransferase n=1 Tax=Lutimonas sp. TaxID=1872403 RepID=UPI003D9B8F37
MIYGFLKQVVRVALFFFFRKIELTGKENIPSEGPVIFVANHPNTLMDPLLVASLIPQRVGFLANASIFVNKFVSAIWRFFHVIPVYRREDVGNGEKPDNRKSFEKCHAYLAKKGNLLVFPEGTSHYELKLREIKTGTARIALSFEALNGFAGNTNIVPIALDYADAIHFRTVVSVTVCKSIKVADYQQQFETDEQHAVVELTEAIRKELAAIIPQTSGKEQELFLVKAHQFYKTFYAPDELGKEGPKEVLELRTQISKALQFIEIKNVALYQDTQKKLLQFSAILKEDKVDMAAVSNFFKGNQSLPKGLFFIVLFVAFFPFYVVGMLFNYIPYIIPSKLFKAMKLDIEYRSSVQMLIGLIVFPLYYALVIWLLGITNIWIVLLLLIVMPMTGYVSMFYYAAFNRFIKVMRIRFLMSDKRKTDLEMLVTDIMKNIEIARSQLI